MVQGLCCRCCSGRDCCAGSPAAAVVVPGVSFVLLLMLICHVATGWHGPPLPCDTAAFYWFLVLFSGIIVSRFEEAPLFIVALD